MPTGLFMPLGVKLVISRVISCSNFHFYAITDFDNFNFSAITANLLTSSSLFGFGMEKLAKQKSHNIYLRISLLDSSL